MNLLEYKGYQAKIEFDAESSILLGTVLHLSDVVTFQATSADTVKKEFHEAVDDYLATCRAIGKEPDKAFSGTFNVRLSPTLHRQLALKASKNNSTLNDFVRECLEQAVLRPKVPSRQEMRVSIHVYNSKDRSDTNSNIGEVSSYESISVGTHTLNPTTRPREGATAH